VGSRRYPTGIWALAQNVKDFGLKPSILGFHPHQHKCWDYSALIIILSS